MACNITTSIELEIEPQKERTPENETLNNIYHFLVSSEFENFILGLNMLSGLDVYEYKAFELAELIMLSFTNKEGRHFAYHFANCNDAIDSEDEPYYSYKDFFRSVFHVKEYESASNDYGSHDNLIFSLLPLGTHIVFTIKFYWYFNKREISVQHIQP